ncbi:MAG: tetrahydromethanopterin S-methyltransferase subunit F [Archaeoglobales archaeon]|nr:tetrahydromethanopterin S-methyltransferase subunit F [Archaeoglobales archaeon]
MNGFPKILKPKTSRIGEIVSEVEYSAQLISRTHKLEAGINMAGIYGFVIGLLFAFVLILVPMLLVG